MENGKIRILVVYHRTAARLRASQSSHLSCFRDSAECESYYINLHARGVPWYLRRLNFDVIAFHTSFDAMRRAEGTYFSRLLDRAAPLRSMSAVKIAFPQDECTHTDRLCEFVNTMGIDVVFSCADESEWPVIYPTVDRSKTRFARVLTGCLDEPSLSRISKLAGEIRDRDIDIGHRVAFRAEWGRFGSYKKVIGDAFRSQSVALGLKTDISERTEDFLLGDDWYRFLLRSKYTLGAESGGSLLDRDGSLATRCQRYCATRPGASFDEIERECFPGMDGTLNLRAIGARHLEACATRTCQVLVEGEYNGILRPWTHYIPVKPDMSNVADVLEIIRKDKLREELVEAAWTDIVASGKYTYPVFVSSVLGEALKNHAARTDAQSAATEAARTLNLVGERIGEAKTDVAERARNIARPWIPEKLLQRWRRR